MYLQKVISRKTSFLKISFLFGVFKVNDENSRILIWIQIHYSEARIRGSGSGSSPECHGSGTLLLRLLYQCTEFFCWLARSLPCIFINKNIQLKTCKCQVCQLLIFGAQKELSPKRIKIFQLRKIDVNLYILGQGIHSD